MVDLKEYFYNTNHYSDPIIKKFIYDFTDKFNPFLLIALNKQFVISYLTEMDEMNEWKVKKDFSILDNLSSIEDLVESPNILCRMYTYSDGIYATEELLEQFDNLGYNDHKEMTIKIQDFQFCIEEIIKTENSKVISQYNFIPGSKEQNLIETTTKENSYLGQPTNDKANDLFEFLIQFYRPDEKTSVKYVNILHYLKKDSRKELYVFKVKQEDYKKIIKEKEGVLISKFQKSEKYNEEEKHILNTLETTFRNQKR